MRLGGAEAGFELVEGGADPRVVAVGEADGRLADGIGDAAQGLADGAGDRAQGIGVAPDGAGETEGGLEVGRAGRDGEAFRDAALAGLVVDVGPADRIEVG